MEIMLLIFLNLNFTWNTLDCYGLNLNCVFCCDSNGKVYGFCFGLQLLRCCSTGTRWWGRGRWVKGSKSRAWKPEGYRSRSSRSDLGPRRARRWRGASSRARSASSSRRRARNASRRKRSSRKREVNAALSPWDRVFSCRHPFNAHFLRGLIFISCEV